MPEIVIIGDIHGRSILLQQLLANIEKQWNWDYLVFLGDYIDRGDDSKGVIDILVSLKNKFSKKIIFLKGNHEQWMLEALDKASSTSWLSGMDGLKVISSYSATLAEEFRQQLKSLGLSIFNKDESVKLPYETFFYEVMPKEHLDFFLSLENYFIVDNLICVHAGIKPGIPVTEQQEDDLFWITEEFYNDYNGKETIVFGHMNAWQLREDQRHIPFKGKNNIIGIDTSPMGVAALKWPSLDYMVFSKNHTLEQGKL